MRLVCLLSFISTFEIFVYELIFFLNCYDLLFHIFFFNYCVYKGIVFQEFGMLLGGSKAVIFHK